jgi:hypothetical protein
MPPGAALSSPSAPVWVGRAAAMQLPEGATTLAELHAALEKAPRRAI